MKINSFIPQIYLITGLRIKLKIALPYLITYLNLFFALISCGVNSPASDCFATSKGGFGRVYIGAAFHSIPVSLGPWRLIGNIPLHLEPMSTANHIKVLLSRLWKEVMKTFVNIMI